MHASQIHHCVGLTVSRMTKYEVTMEMAGNPKHKVRMRKM